MAARLPWRLGGCGGWAAVASGLLWQLGCYGCRTAMAAKPLVAAWPLWLLGHCNRSPSVFPFGSLFMCNNVMHYICEAEEKVNQQTNI